MAMGQRVRKRQPDGGYVRPRRDLRRYVPDFAATLLD